MAPDNISTESRYDRTQRKTSMIRKITELRKKKKKKPLTMVMDFKRRILMDTKIISFEKGREVYSVIFEESKFLTKEVTK